jgi:hypothetical protein
VIVDDVGVYEAEKAASKPSPEAYQRIDADGNIIPPAKIIQLNSFKKGREHL